MPHLVISWVLLEWWVHHPSVQSISMLSIPFYEEFPPYVWSEPLSAQFVAMSSCPVLGEEIEPSLLEQFVYIVTECQTQEDWKRPGLPVQPQCSRRVSQNTLLQILSRQLFNISREQDFSTSLGSQFQCLATLTEKFFSIFTCNLLCPSFHPFSPVLFLVTTEESLPRSYWDIVDIEIIK